MTEERQPSQQKVVKAVFEGDSELPVPYVNIVSVRGGIEEFFITLGIAVPPEITDIKDLENIDTVKTRGLFRFAMSRQVMKDVIEVMQRMYDQQTNQIEMLRTLQKGGGDDDENPISSRSL